MYGPISMSGEVNGNAGFGVKNSPVPSKMASILSAPDPGPYAPSRPGEYAEAIISLPIGPKGIVFDQILTPALFFKFGR